MIIDTHPHLLADDVSRYPIAPLGGVQSEWSRGVHLTAEEFLKHMDAAGVEKAILVQASTFHGYDNSYTADSVAKYPDRFAGVGCVDPQATDVSKVLKYWVSERGLSGIRLFLSGSTVQQSISLDDDSLRPFWETAADLRLVVCAQTSEYGQVASVAEEFPPVTITVDHLGGVRANDGPPFQLAEPLFALADIPNVVLKFSNNNLKNANTGESTTESFFLELIKRFGRERMMWGSNFPNTRSDSATPYVDSVNYARQSLAFLDGDDRNWLLGEAAAATYPVLRAS